MSLPADQWCGDCGFNHEGRCPVRFLHVRCRGCNRYLGGMRETDRGFQDFECERCGRKWDAYVCEGSVRLIEADLRPRRELTERRRRVKMTTVTE